MNESDRGERSVEESERRLQLFATQVTQRGLVAEGKFKLQRSRTALETFLQLNLGILNIKKVGPRVFFPLDGCLIEV
jgi:hypothetical protein